MKLTDKIAIVTGSSRGIGKAIALGFSKEGAKVVIAARTEVDNEQLPGTIFKTAEDIKALGGRAIPMKCDITSEQGVNDMVNRTLNEFGHIDILVNNAATSYAFPIIDTPLKRWELVMRVNLNGMFLCTRAVLPRMIERRSGNIINVSSVGATIRGPFFAGVAYGVTKAGIERFTWGLAAEVGQYGIIVNCLKPRGGVNTEGVRLVLPEPDASQLDSPDMMVKAGLFLAAQEAGGITGMVASDEELCAWYGLKL